jgi:hypothetical protein
MSSDLNVIDFKVIRTYPFKNFIYIYMREIRT